MDIFFPSRLMRQKELIKSNHAFSNTYIDPIGPSEELRDLVVGISKLKAARIKQKALVLTDKEVYSIVVYIPYNYYHVDLNNLFKVFCFRATAELCASFFKEWQNAYDNTECNRLFLEYIVEIDSFISMIQGINYSEDIFCDMIRAESIPVWYGHYCKKNLKGLDKNLYEKIEYLGINENTKLYKDIHYLFYTFCDREDYLEGIGGSFRSIVDSYAVNSAKFLREFIINFLSKMTLEDLRMYLDIAEILQKNTGPNDSTEQKKYFEEIDPELWRKYRNWLNLANIHKYFGDDERSIFWENYEFISIRYHSRSNSVSMETSNYYIVEFLGKAMGPMYIYEKDIFNGKIVKWCSYKNNTDLRQSLLHTELYFERIRHAPNPGWDKIFEKYIVNHNITQRVLWE